MRKKVAIIGLGLIGGSIAMAIKRHQNVHIIGVEKNDKYRRKALELGIVDNCYNSVDTGIVDAEFIVIATPVSTTIEIMTKLHELPLKNDVLITDVGSTKEKIVDHSRIIEKENISFIGGHPMAGNYQNGIDHARADLFEDKFYILTPSTNSNVNKVKLLKKWLAGTKARFITMDPGIHDKLAGSISHLPHVIASLLVHQIEDLEGTYPVLGALAAGGFRVITRNASADPIMWSDISLQNKEVLLQMLLEFQKRIRGAIELLEAGEREELLNFYRRAKQYRDTMPVVGCTLQANMKKLG